MASTDVISISMIIIGVAYTAGIFGTKCFTVRSALTRTMRSALMPTVMTSRASMDCLKARVPDAVRHSSCRSAEPGPRFSEDSWAPALQRTAPRRATRCAASGARRLLALRRPALDEGLSTLHLVRQRRLVDLDHDGV